MSVVHIVVFIHHVIAFFVQRHLMPWNRAVNHDSTRKIIMFRSYFRSPIYKKSHLAQKDPIISAITTWSKSGEILFVTHINIVTTLGINDVFWQTSWTTEIHVNYIHHNLSFLLYHLHPKIYPLTMLNF